MRYRQSDRTCTECGATLSVRNRSGVCRGKCYDAKRLRRDTPCRECGGPLGAGNISGRCQACHLRSARASGSNEGRRGEANANWRGGRVVGERGYVLVRTPTGYRREHRVVMEATIGRALTAREVVHHVDGSTDNNSPANLELYACNADHMHRHRTGDYSSRLWPPV